MRGVGQTSGPVLVLLDTSLLLVAEFWQSSEPNQPPKWFYSEDVYQFEQPYREICEQVTGWIDITAWEYQPVGLFIQTSDPAYGAFQRGRFAVLVEISKEVMQP